MRKSCPVCRMPLAERPGGFVAFPDADGRGVAFIVCAACDQRLHQLPHRLQQRQASAALRAIAQHPERFEAYTFADSYQARIYAHLEAERCRKLAGSLI